MPAATFSLCGRHVLIFIPAGFSTSKYEEAFRILRPGGRLAISDIVLTENIDSQLRERFQATWVGCLGGAILEKRYWHTMRNAGFTKIKTAKGLDFTMNAMWREIRNINFTKEIQSMKVPIFFFEGKYDMIAPAVIVENFYNNLNAEKGKKLIVFENSAHVPMLEEKEKYEDLLINVVLKESQDK